MRRPDLSVVVVTWNCREEVLACLAALEAGRGSLSTEVIVVDNASADGTAGAVRAAHPGARVLEPGANLGFPRANNLGLAEAGGRNVLFLNPDTEVGGGTLEACVAELDGDPSVGVVGCRLEYPDGRIQLEGGRRDYRLRHLLWEALYLNALFPRSPVFAHQLEGDWDHRGVRDVEAVMGAFMMARADVARAVGGLPDEVFMYHEDLAFCLRVRRAGWRVRYRGDVVTVHHGGASAGRADSPLHLLEGEVRVRLIRERDGAPAGAAARALFGLRSLSRLLLALAGRAAPGLGRLRAAHPKAFAPGVHWTHLLWSVAPSLVADRMPRPESAPADARLAVSPGPARGSP